MRRSLPGDQSDGRSIGIDGRTLTMAEATGVATYTRTLAGCLPTIGLVPDILVDRAGWEPYDAADPRSLEARLRRWMRALQRSDRVTHLAAADGARGRALEPFPASRIRFAEDVFRIGQVHFDVYRRLLRLTGTSLPRLMHWTYPQPLVFRGLANVYTLHDLIPISAPELTGIPVKRYRRILSAVLAQADHVVTVSETSRRQIIDLLHYPEHKVTNAYQAADAPATLAVRPEHEVRAEIAPILGAVAQSYLLFVGTIEPRKNVGRLVEAYITSGARTPLVLAGPVGWRADEELQAVAGHELSRAEIEAAAGAGRPGFLRLGYLPHATLMSLVRGAKALLFPSLAEGFGLPIVEAMSLGTPVMTSRGGATGEIAGAAGALVDPRDMRKMAETIAKLDADADWRAALARQGRARAATFTVEAYKKRLAELYDRLLAAPH